MTKLFTALCVCAITAGVKANAACDLSATTSNFASQVSAAQAGQTICLASGDYGAWSGVNKAITLTKQSGATPSIEMAFNTGVGGFTIDGVVVRGGEILNGAKNITV